MGPHTYTVLRPDNQEIPLVWANFVYHFVTYEYLISHSKFKQLFHKYIRIVTNDSLSFQIFISYILNVCASFVDYLFCPTYIFIDVLLDKQKEVLDTMIQHGIMDGLCEIFSTSADEDTLVWMSSFIFFTFYFI